MRLFNGFVCPETQQPLKLEILKEDNEIINGMLTTSNGNKYIIKNGFPYLIFPKQLPKEELEIINWYENNYEVYDEFLPLTFKTFNVDERTERMNMISSLNIQPHFKVLETGAGTGRDSVLIAAQLNQNGELHVHDIFDKILEKSVEKLKSYNTNIYYCVSNAIYLPYADNYFDVYYHFGGFNTFSDKKRAFAEINRVVKPGGKVIVGDESMPIWLRDTDFGKILMNSNPHYKYHIPWEDLCISSRDVSLHYIIGGVFYYLTYTVGEGEPYADFDFEIPGARGGTHRTRYYGHIEGVSQEAISLAKEAHVKSGKSLHRWLDDVIKNAANNEFTSNE